MGIFKHVDKVTDKIDDAAKQVDEHVSKVKQWFINNKKTIISSVITGAVCLIIGLCIGIIL